jgi:hypothetical protein
LEDHQTTGGRSTTFKSTKLNSGAEESSVESCPYWQ